MLVCPVNGGQGTVVDHIRNNEYLTHIFFFNFPCQRLFITDAFDDHVGIILYIVCPGYVQHRGSLEIL